MEIQSSRSGAAKLFGAVFMVGQVPKIFYTASYQLYIADLKTQVNTLDNI